MPFSLKLMLYVFNISQTSERRKVFFKQDRKSIKRRLENLTLLKSKIGMHLSNDSKNKNKPQKQRRYWQHT